MSAANALITIGELRNEIANPVDFAQVKNVRSRAHAIWHFLRDSKEGRERQNQAAEIMIRADRALGTMLTQLRLREKRTRNLRQAKDGEDDAQLSLESLGIDKSKSSRLQKLAAIDESILNDYIEAVKIAGDELTTTGFIRFTRESRENDFPTPGTGIIACRSLAMKGERFGCILLDIREVAKETVKQIPLRDLSAPQSHTHLVANDSTLGAAVAAMQSGGFTVSSAIVWTTRLSPAPYWPCQNEYLLLGVKGKLPFAPVKLLDQGISERFGTVEKLRETLEIVSPGPYLQLFSERPRRNWIVISEGED